MPESDDASFGQVAKCIRCPRMDESVRARLLLVQNYASNRIATVLVSPVLVETVMLCASCALLDDDIVDVP